MSDVIDDVTRELASECYAFCASRLVRRVHRMYDQALRPHGLRNQQLAVLRAVKRRPGLRPIDLSRIMGAEKSTITRVLRTLQDGGLAEVRAMRGNARQKAVWITPTGSARLAAAQPAWEEAQREVANLLGNFGDGLKLAALN
jgi:DNA-binding MarR family transcriptional regulator